MNQLSIFNRDGILLTDSREVAKMVDKNHFDLLRDIRKYCVYLGESKIALSDFFIESSYTNAQNKEQPSYLITRKGCDMIANKLTGKKGVLFTAAYVSQFEKMENQLSSQKLPIDFLSALKALVSIKPRADYTDHILQSKSLVTITQIAKDYGMSGSKMNVLLHDHGIQYKQSGQWLLYGKHHDKGYTHSETVDIRHSDGGHSVKMNTKWTQKGRLFIYNLLKKDGVLPLIEIEGKQKSA